MDEETHDSFGTWLARLESGNSDATERLWEQYFQRLTTVAKARIPKMRRRVFDEEDVALSALKSFCDGVQNGKYPRLSGEENLWALLVLITKRKAAHRIRDEAAKKRGGGNLQGESAFGENGIQGLVKDVPSGEFATQMVEELDHLRELLKDEQLERIALLRMQGLTNAEIAKEMDCVERTIDRRLALIRNIWINSVEEGE